MRDANSLAKVAHTFLLEFSLCVYKMDISCSLVKKRNVVVSVLLVDGGIMASMEKVRCQLSL